MVRNKSASKRVYVTYCIFIRGNRDQATLFHGIIGDILRLIIRPGVKQPPDMWVYEHTILPQYEEEERGHKTKAQDGGYPAHRYAEDLEVQ